MPLKMLGYSLNSTDPKELDEAKKLLLDLAPHVLALDSDTYQDKLASEEAVLCLGWTGPLLELRADPETADTKYVVPSEGTLFWMDAWVMMADAPHPNATYAWFDFIERPGHPGQGDRRTTGYAHAEPGGQEAGPAGDARRSGRLPAGRRHGQPRRRRPGLHGQRGSAGGLDRVQVEPRRLSEPD